MTFLLLTEATTGCCLIVPGVHYYHLDVTDFAAIESTAETIRREHGDPTVLINNAGIGE